MLGAESTRELIWAGCYDDSWKGLIVDEAFAHPAKFARGLIRRIYRHAIERGWLAAGSVVVDPFGGVALGALDAMQAGILWMGCELEERFCLLARQNLAKWKRCGLTGATILQGDSRNLCAVLGAAGVDCVVSSPPYAECIDTRNAPSGMNVKTRSDGSPMGYGKSECQMNAAGYGSTPGQLGAMRPGSVDAVVSSPPFQGSLTGEERKDNSILGQQQRGENHRLTQGGKCGRSMNQDYGSTPGQLGNLPPGTLADAVIGSPPFEASLTIGAGGGLEPSIGKYPQWRSKESVERLGGNYGTAPGNIGNDTGETFWTAAREIVQQCYQILRPGGVAIWVCKDFVRKGQRVPFSADWERLCVSCGFEPLEWIRASLVKEQRHAGLFDAEIVKTKERKSFFRRLAEKKGSPRIDHEDVVILQKP